MQSAARGAEEFADFHPLGIGDVVVGIDFTQGLAVIANMNEGAELPIPAIIPKSWPHSHLVTAMTRLNDEQMRTYRQ